MSQNLETVFYEVDADTAKLIEASRRANAELGRLGSSFDKNAKSAGKLNPAFKQAGAGTDELSKAFFELGKRAEGAIDPLRVLQGLALGYTSFSTARGIVDLADDYELMSSRIKLTIQDMSEYEGVQKRLLDTANKAQRPVQEMQSIFIDTSGNLRDMGYSLEEALNITDSFSYALVRNATDAQRAAGALKAYDVALNKKRVDSMMWQSISSALPSLEVSMSKIFDIPLAKIQEMGFEGKITADMLNEAFQKSYEDNKKAAESMSKTVSGSFTVLRNNFREFIGEANQASNATDTVAQGLEILAKNLNSVSTVLLTVGAGALAKYTAGLAIKITSNLKATASAITQAKAELRLAQEQERQAKSAMILAQKNAIGGASHKKAAAMAGAHALAVAKVATANKAVNNASISLMGLLGGPAGLVGIVAAVATGFTLFGNKTDEVKESVNEILEPLDELIKKFKELSDTQRQMKIDQYFSEQGEKVKKAAAENERLLKQSTIAVSKAYSESQKGFKTNVEHIKAEVIQAFADAELSGKSLAEVLNGLAEKYGVPEEALISLRAQAAATETAGKEADTASFNYKKLTEQQNELKTSTDSATTALERQARAASEAGQAVSDSIRKRLDSRLNDISDAGSEYKRVLREIEAAEAENKTFKPDERAKLLEDAKKIDDSNKKLNHSTNQNAEAIQGLQKSISLATLSAREYAIAKAEASLTDVATQDEINKVRELAAALYDTQQIMAQKRKFGETGEEADKYILGDANPLLGGMFDDQYARYEAEAVAEQERYAAQLERLKEARELQIETQKDYYALEEEAAKTHADRMAQIEQAKSQVILNSFGSAFDAMAGIMEKAHGDQSTAYKAMFALSQGFALAEAGLNISKALSQVLADPSAMTTTQKLSNYALIAAEGTKILSGIGNIAYGGGRQYGGPVAANKMYRVNETGQPEIFNAANGQQFLLPTQNGSVTPAGKGGGSVNLNPTFTINIDAPSGMDTEELAKLTVQIADNRFQKLLRENFRPGGAFYGVRM